MLKGVAAIIDSSVACQFIKFGYIRETLPIHLSF